MSEAIVVALITGGLSFLGVLLTTSAASKKQSVDIRTDLAVIQADIKALSRDVQKHNNFAERIPAVEAEVKSIEDRLNRLESQL